MSEGLLTGAEMSQNNGYYQKPSPARVAVHTVGPGALTEQPAGRPLEAGECRFQVAQVIQDSLRQIWLAICFFWAIWLT